jgi:hypothetical protein
MQKQEVFAVCVGVGDKIEFVHATNSRSGVRVESRTEVIQKKSIYDGWVWFDFESGFVKCFNPHANVSVLL